MDKIELAAFTNVNIAMLWAVTLTFWVVKMCELSEYLQKYIGYFLSTIIGYIGIGVFLKISQHLYQLLNLKIIL